MPDTSAIEHVLSRAGLSAAAARRLAAALSAASPGAFDPAELDPRDALRTALLAAIVAAAEHAQRVLPAARALQHARLGRPEPVDGARPGRRFAGGLHAGADRAWGAAVTIRLADRPADPR